MSCIAPERVVAVDIGVKHFAYAIIGKTNSLPEIIDFDIIELDKNNGLINDLIEWFNKFNNLKCVIIEQQVKNNVKALIIQNIIMAICTLKSIDYYVFNPKLKFKLMGDTWDTVPVKMKESKIPKGKAYKERKQKSIDYILMYFNKYNLIDMKLKFMRFIKKDDVADALNMGIMYLYGLKSKKIIEIYKV